MKPDRVTWPLEDHTRAKHEILRRYLRAWFPILALGGFPRMVFIDGFAGPGIYDDGSDGSPLIALKAFLDQSAPILAECHFHFIEKEEARADRLRECMASLFAARPRPHNLHVRVHSGEGFEQVYATALRDHPRNAPVFALVDPFGWNGIPMTAMRDLMNRASGEVLVNFMFEEINRFLTHRDQPDNFDALFGCADWRKVAALPPAQRKAGIRDLYAAQLVSMAGARFVRHFEMRNGRERTDYYLFFATKNQKGLKKMKEAMWSVDQRGGMAFSDATDPGQQVLFDGSDLSQLEGILARRFSGAAADVDEIERFVVEETAFRETHYKGILKGMEARVPAAIQVEACREGRRRGTYPAGTRVRFA
jgi:three-Cys-motif partner protein